MSTINEAAIIPDKTHKNNFMSRLIKQVKERTHNSINCTIFTSWCYYYQTAILLQPQPIPQRACIPRVLAENPYNMHSDDEHLYQYKNKTHPLPEI